MHEPYWIIKKKNSLLMQVGSGNAGEKRGHTHASSYFVKPNVSIQPPDPHVNGSLYRKGRNVGMRIPHQKRAMGCHWRCQESRVSPPCAFHIAIEEILHAQWMHKLGVGFRTGSRKIPG